MELFWPDAVYGEKYIVCYEKYDSDEKILFGVIQREGTAFVSAVLESCNSALGTDYKYVSEYNGPNLHFYGKYDDLHAFRITGTDEIPELTVESVEDYRFIYPTDRHLLLYYNGGVYTMQEGSLSETVSPILQKHLEEIWQAYYSSRIYSTLKARKGLESLLGPESAGGSVYVSFVPDWRKYTGQEEKVCLKESNWLTSPKTDWNRIRFLNWFLGETEIETGDLPDYSDNSVLLLNRDDNPYSLLLFPDRTGLILREDQQEGYCHSVCLSRSDLFPWLLQSLITECPDYMSHAGALRE